MLCHRQYMGWSKTLELDYSAYTGHFFVILFAKIIKKCILTEFIKIDIKSDSTHVKRYCKLDQTHPMWKACSLRQTQRVNSMRLQNGRCRTPAARVRSLCERHRAAAARAADTHSAFVVAALTARSVRHARLLLASLCARVAQTLPPL